MFVGLRDIRPLLGFVGPSYYSWGRRQQNEPFQTSIQLGDGPVPFRTLLLLRLEERLTGSGWEGSMVSLGASLGTHTLGRERYTPSKDPSGWRGKSNQALA